MANACPERVGGDIPDDDWLLSIGGGSAGPDRRADLDSINRLYVFFGQAGSGAVPQSGSVGVEQKNGAEQTGMLFFNVRGQGCQYFRQRSLGPDHSQHALV